MYIQTVASPVLPAGGVWTTWGSTTPRAAASGPRWSRPWTRHASCPHRLSTPSAHTLASAAQLLLAEYSSRADEEEEADGLGDAAEDEEQTWAAWAYSWCVLL